MPSTYYETHEPDKEYLRMGTIYRWLMAQGFSHSQVRKLFEARVIVPAKQFDGCRAWYSRTQIKEKILS